MFGSKPVTLLVKLPAPVPSSVLLSSIVGFSFVLQQTPCTVIGAPPSEVMLPPLFAVVCVMSVIAVVDNTGMPVLLPFPLSSSSFLQLLAKIKNTPINNNGKIKLFVFFLIIIKCNC